MVERLAHATTNTTSEIVKMVSRGRSLTSAPQ
jgi:hypothetical protein